MGPIDENQTAAQVAVHVDRVIDASGKR